MTVDIVDEVIRSVDIVGEVTRTVSFSLLVLSLIDIE